MAKAEKLTPMMKQYLDIKNEYPDTLLLYRMGDFYETFFEDAKTLSKVLGIALTKRGGENSTPLAGFPYHALDAHLPKLLQAGYKVARCEQVEDPKKAKGIVKRDVVEIVSAGSTFSEKLLDHKTNNFIASLYLSGEEVGLALADISTGELFIREFSSSQLSELILQYLPQEILLAESQKAFFEEALPGELKATLSSEADWFFDFNYAHDLLLKQMNTHSLKGFGCEDMTHAISAAGALLNYLRSNYKSELKHVLSIELIQSNLFMTLDASTRRNLEIYQTIQGDFGQGSLISILDRTKTAMGARLIKKWIVQPLLDREKIIERLDMLECLISSEEKHSKLIEIVNEIGDIERILARISTGRCSPRDLIFMKSSLEKIQPLQDLLLSLSDKNWERLGNSFVDVSTVIKAIDSAINPDAPNTITEGNIIRKGYHSELDELKSIAHEGKNFIISLQVKEREATGISSLKINYNKVFGYYIEVRNTHKDKIPAHYIRKQTLVNSERYISEELKEYEEKVLGAEEKINDLEYELFHELRQSVSDEAKKIQVNARLVAESDCLQSFSTVSKEQGYSKPNIENTERLIFKNGRHPVVEQLLDAGQSFTANDVFMTTEEDQIMLITGPNMAGKSTYLRQIGLIVLMAQIGCFVPADDAHIGIVDRIFTRVGASDNLSHGESTFLVEMNEAANILNNASTKSLILFDELGRGTSTFDGLSIAWSVVEYLHTNKNRAAKTLFATHYHELTELEMLYPRIKNYNIAVEEYDDQIIFLRKILRGGTDNSYGIQVAKMAGLPLPVIERAKEILSNLEENELNPTTKKPKLAARQRGRFVDSNQMALFNVAEKKKESEVEKYLKKLSLNNLTPLDALNELNELQKLATKDDS